MKHNYNKGKTIEHNYEKCYCVKIGDFLLYDNITYNRARTIKAQYENEGFRELKILKEEK